MGKGGGGGGGGDEGLRGEGGRGVKDFLRKHFNARLIVAIKMQIYEKQVQTSLPLPHLSLSFTASTK